MILIRCQVLEGDDCSSISVKYGISLADFYFLNPQVDSNCTNLWLNTSYCVAPVGNIATYSGYSVSTPSYTFTKPPKTTATPTPVPLPTLNPRAPDTVSDCDLYDNPFFANTTNAMRYNSCENWAQIAGVTVQDLISWNPSLSASNCTLDAEYSYCIISGQTPREYSFYPWCIKSYIDPVSLCQLPSTCRMIIAFQQIPVSFHPPLFNRPTATAISSFARRTNVSYPSNCPRSGYRIP